MNRSVEKDGDKHEVLGRGCRYRCLPLFSACRCLHLNIWTCGSQGYLHPPSSLISSPVPFQLKSKTSPLLWLTLFASPPCVIVPDDGRQKLRGGVEDTCTMLHHAHHHNDGAEAPTLVDPNIISRFLLLFPFLFSPFSLAHCPSTVLPVIL